MRYLGIWAIAAATSILSAQTTSIRVSQESAPGVGDFDANVLGTIAVFSATGQTAAQVYQYNTPLGSSFNGSLITTESSKTKMFGVNTSEGLVLVVVHDKPIDGSGGSAQMRFEITGDPSGATRLVEDDPGDTGRAGNLFGPNIIQTVHGWDPCCTDGVVIGALEGPWSMLVQFNNVTADPTPIDGITTWEATSANNANILLALQLGRRVRLDLVLNVTIDIKPGGFPNSINLGSNGVVPVAILSSPTFDASTVDPSTITLAGASVRLRGQGTLMASLQDVSGDGRLDLVVQVSTEALQLTEGDIMATLQARTYSGLQIVGQDSVRIVP